MIHQKVVFFFKMNGIKIFFINTDTVVKIIMFKILYILMINNNINKLAMKKLLA